MLSSMDFPVLFVCSLITFLFSLLFPNKPPLYIIILDAAFSISPWKPDERSPDVRCLMKRLLSSAFRPPIRDFPGYQMNIVKFTELYHNDTI